MLLLLLALIFGDGTGTPPVSLAPVRLTITSAPVVSTTITSSPTVRMTITRSV